MALKSGKSNLEVIEDRKVAAVCIDGVFRRPRGWCGEVAGGERFMF